MNLQNDHTTHRQSLPKDPNHVDNIVESLFYRMLSLNMENNIDEFLDIIDFESCDNHLIPEIKRKLCHRLNVIGIRP